MYAHTHTHSDTFISQSLKLEALEVNCVLNRLGLLTEEEEQNKKKQTNQLSTNRFDVF